MFQKISENLFEILSKESISEKELSAIKLMINYLPELNRLQSKQIDIVTEIFNLVSVDVEKYKDVGVNDLRNKNNTPILIAAVESRHLSVVKLLIEVNASLDVRSTFYESTGVMLAAASGNVLMLKTLILGGANLNLNNRSGNTALHLVRDEAKLQLLIEFGADKTIKNLNGDTALDLAIREKAYPNWVNILLRNDFVGRAAGVYDYLIRCDQSDPTVLDSMIILYQKQQELCAGGAPGNDKFDRLSESSYQKLENQIIKLKNLVQFRVSNDDARLQLDKNIDQSIDKLPKDLVNLIGGYAYPPLAGLSIFKFEDTDKLFVENFLAAKKQKLR